jgi:ribosomal protein L37AE/L43A
MKLSIAKCHKCQRARLVDSVNGRWVCFACKQKIGKAALKVLGTPMESLMAVEAPMLAR